jgi:hypothetical protein
VKAELKTLWGIGDHSVAQLSEKYGLPADVISGFLQRQKIRKGSKAKEIAAKQQAAVEAAMTLDPAVHARRVFDTKNETYRILEMLRKLVAKEVVRTQTEKLPLGSIANDMKAIREAAAAIKICREEAYAVLGITVDEAGDDQLPPLEIRDLTEDQIQDLQAQAMQDVVADLPDKLPGEPDDDIVIEGEDDDD